MGGIPEGGVEALEGGRSRILSARRYSTCGDDILKNQVSGGRLGWGFLVGVINESSDGCLDK